MAYSRVSYTGTGSTLNATIPFAYLDKADVQVLVNDVSVPFTFLNASTVTPTVAPASGAIVQVRRITQKTSVPVNFTDGSVLLEQDLDLLGTYSLYLAQETQDGVDSTLRENYRNEMDARGLRIVNVSPGTEATDAASLSQVTAVADYTESLVELSVVTNLGYSTDAALSAFEAGESERRVEEALLSSPAVAALAVNLAAPTGSGLVGYMPNGVGAVATDVNSTLNQRVSLFGFMTPAQRSDVSAGTALLDVTDAIRTAFIVAKWASTGNFDIQQHSRGMTVNAPPGRYRVNGEIPIFAGLHFCGSGSNATVFVQESTTSNTFAFLNDEGGTADPLVLADFAVVQKLGTVPTAGYAIFADKPAATPDRATALTMRNVFTQDTWGGVYVDWCFTSDYTKVITNRHTNGIVLGYYNTSSVFNACMGNACVNSGFKIAGTYITFNACEANANGRDGFEVYSPSGVLNRNISFVSPGAENNGRHQISVSKSSGTTILTPHMVGLTAGDSPMMLSDTTGTFISGFDASVPAANANPALKLNNTGGAYPIGTTLMADSFVSTNYASPVSDSDRVYWLDSDAQVGAYKGTFRFGTKTRYVKDAQKLYQGSPLPTTAVSSWARMLPEANQAYTQATGYSIKFSVNAPAATIAVLQAGHYVEVPTITAGTVTRYEGSRIADMPAGGSADANLVLGDATVPVGRWSLFNPSTKDNLFYGPIRWGSSTGPRDAFGTGTPEGAVTAAVGSTFRRTDGGGSTSFYVKESGTGNTGWVAK